MLARMNDARGGRSSTRPAPRRAIAQRFEADLSATVLAAGSRISNVRQISERVAMGRSLWRELVIGFASQLGDLRLGFTQLAALYVLADGSTLTVGELAESINRSPSATSRLVDGLVKRRLVERRAEEEDRRQKILRLTPRGHAVLRVVDRGRAEQFLSAVRPMPSAERAIVAMGVAALATHAISRRGRLVSGVRRESTSEPSAAEAPGHVVQDRQSEPECVERHPFVHAVETLEEALVRVEPKG
jgi:DNA-binding MarR family transcriptional regulator